MLSRIFAIDRQSATRERVRGGGVEVLVKYPIISLLLMALCIGIIVFAILWK